MGKHFSRSALVFFAVVVGSAIGLPLWSDNTQPALGNQLATGGIAANGLITHVIDGSGRATRVVVVDPQQRSMGVYEISQDSGKIELMSVRKLTADLQMLEYNNTGISVEDIQKAHQRQQ